YHPFQQLLTSPFNVQYRFRLRAVQPKSIQWIVRNQTYALPACPVKSSRNTIVSRGVVSLVPA
ncbi:MAG: hypothetical protein M1399_09910, partial [Actinobacteria bacterium]|nr:hypothetical protein [Actinomycetota bacterium]